MSTKLTVRERNARVLAVLKRSRGSVTTAQIVGTLDVWEKPVDTASVSRALYSLRAAGTVVSHPIPGRTRSGYGWHAIRA